MSAAPLTPLIITCSPYRERPQQVLQLAANELRARHLESMAAELEKRIQEVASFEAATDLAGRFLRVEVDAERLAGTSPEGAAALLRVLFAKHDWDHVDLTVTPADTYIYAQWRSRRDAKGGAQGFSSSVPLLTAAFAELPRMEQGRTLAKLTELMGMAPHHPGKKPFWGTELGKIWFAMRLTPHRGRAAVLSEEKLLGDHAHPEIFSTAARREPAESINAQ